MRKTVAIVAAIVVAVLAVVSARALASPIAWAAAAVLVVATIAAVATLSLTPTIQRVVVILGALLGLAAIALAIVEFGVRGYRTASSAPLLGLLAGVAGLLVILGVAAARSAPTPTALWSGAAVLAAIALVFGVVVGTTVPYLPLSRSISYTSADASTTLTLNAPGGAKTGDTLVAQVFRSGTGAVQGPPGWQPLRTTPLPGGSGSVSLFTTVATDATGRGDLHRPYPGDAARRGRRVVARRGGQCPGRGHRERRSRHGGPGAGQTTPPRSSTSWRAPASPT